MKEQIPNEKAENLFDCYYNQDTNSEDDETVMAGYGIYGAYSASCCC